MFLQEQGTQVLFKRSNDYPLEPAWVATCHDETTLDIWTLKGLLQKVTYGGGVGQWRMMLSKGHWVLESDDVNPVFGIETEAENERFNELASRIERLELIPITAPDVSYDALEERITALEMKRDRAVNSVDSTPVPQAQSATTPAPVTSNGLE